MRINGTNTLFTHGYHGNCSIMFVLILYLYVSSVNVCVCVCVHA